jgi:predicted Zn-dependent protease
LKPIRLIASLLVAVALALLAAPAASIAQGSGRIPLIRDAEIENTIRVFARPVLEAAGLEPGALSVHLVLDDRLNAFVAGGQRIFVNTGLLRNAEDANSIIGVLAHETGHIAGGHLAQMQDNLHNASAQSVIALVLGAVAAGVSGNPEALIAGATMGQSAATGAFLHYNRSMESQADQAALRYLDQTGQSARGLMNVLNKLHNQEVLAAGRQDPYLRTHPLSQERLDTVRTHVNQSLYSDVAPNELLNYLQDRVRGKLNGYIDPPERTLTRYKADDNSIEARYARVYALEKNHRTDEAVATIDNLIAEKPNDAFFHETKGFVLWTAGRVQESIAPYRASVKLANGLPLLRMNLAQALLELEGRDAASEAVEQLVQVTRFERRMPRAWRLLATGYGRLEDFGATAYALAEEAMLLRDGEGVKRNVAKALELLPPGSPMHSRALDIRYLMEGMDKPG